MAFIRLTVLYTALILGANVAAADFAGLEALRDGDMRKLVFHKEPKVSSTVAFFDENGDEITLEAFRGKFVVLNFWATWCAPCRKEMPSLSRLQKELGGENFEVVAIATGRNQPAAVKRFLHNVVADELVGYRDPKQTLARYMGILALPITVVLDPDGMEIARLRGDARWDSDSAMAIFTEMISGQ